MYMLSHFSHVQLFATYELYPARFLCPWDPPGKNSRVGCHAVLQGIFPIQGSNPCPISPALKAGSLPLAPPGKRQPIYIYIYRQKEKKVSEDERAGCHHRCNEHEPGQTPGDGRDKEAWHAAVHGVTKS